MKKNSRFAGFYMGLIFFLMYLPIAVVIVFSFNESKLPVKFTGFSLKWYQELFHDRAMLEALVNSLILGVLSCLVSAVIGTLGAVGLSRIHWKSKDALEYISILPLMIPEIILGMVLMAFFYMLNLPFGMLTLLIGHTVFCVPYILMEVKARLAGMDPALEEAARDLAVRVQDLDVKIVSQMGGLIELARMEESDILVTAIVGMIGIRPTMEAILAGKDIALANKETLVTAGHLIMPLAKQFGVQILPVDSEHSAIFQALHGEKREQIHKLLITASGGPFRGKKTADLEKVTLDDIRNFGMIPEFIGRLPIIFTLDGLNEDMLVKILQEPKNAILKQYQKLLALDEVKLEFEDGALHAIAAKALERDTGARALRAILEEYMLDIMYEIPKDDSIGEVVITREYIEGNGGPKILLRGQEPILLEGSH